MGAMKDLAIKIAEAQDHYRRLASDDQEGYCLLDHGSRSVDELNADIIREALESGWHGTDATSASAHLKAYDAEPREAWSTWSLSIKRSELIMEYADLGESWLNDHVAPSGYAFGNDGDMGCFGLWLVESDDDQ